MGAFIGQPSFMIFDEAFSVIVKLREGSFPALVFMHQVCCVEK